MGFLNRQRTGFLCLGMAIAFLVVGWWPFAPAPRNRVEWLRPGPGLDFHPPGIAYDEHLLPWSAASAKAGFTIELQIEAGLEPRTNVTHILTVHDDALPSRFALCQWKSELILRVPGPGQPRGFREAGADVLPQRQPRVVMVVCGAAGTTFYADGRPVARFPRFVVPEDSLRGRLILGEAAAGKQAWTGRLRGVAIHHRALDAAEVTRRHRAWTVRDAAALAGDPAPAALYLFEEGAGAHAASRAGAQHRLEIPARYRVLQATPLVLARDWAALWRTDARDIAVNLLGFVPFGFLVFHHRRLGRTHRVMGAAVFAVLAGGALSLIIEVGQVWLPTRVSSATDLILNTAGTALGVVVGVAVWLWLKPQAGAANSAWDTRG